ncbi:hypothetical protein TSOC_002466 [Tetrabaena socialis]|uniref:Protein kinase domain-containing protein n=1 Tax=Tetrabaena socialis TaxID=47790 RepID=A0A2J8ADZ5_9CHLO|nr:hypothetical protein TSOC_002466 [Tetrabaena socialis]|eukprot:PNH10751.1 hypothetical protein TSOC_002466 [Tetrabaena socialis]
MAGVEQIHARREQEGAAVDEAASGSAGTAQGSPVQRCEKRSRQTHAGDGTIQAPLAQLGGEAQQWEARLREVELRIPSCPPETKAELEEQRGYLRQQLEDLGARRAKLEATLGVAAGMGPGSAAAAGGVAAGLGSGSTAPGGGDRTASFLQAVALPNAAPEASQLSQLFTRPLVRTDGNALKLPVHAWVFNILCTLDGSMAELLEPESLSGAWALSLLVSSALHPTAQLHDLPADEPSVAGRVDELFGRVLSLMARFLGGEVLARKRSRKERSVDTSLERPGFYGAAARCAAGEDEGDDGTLDSARMDLLVKVQGWSSVYQGQVEYLLCYACAGSAFELLYQLHTDDRTQALLHLLRADTSAARGKVAVIKAAMLVYGIIVQQQHHLPAGAQLMNSVSSGEYGSLLMGDRYVVKTVAWCRMWQLGAQLESLQQLYNSVDSCPYVVHALAGPVVVRGKYEVTLSPRGRSLTGSWRPADSEQLAAAIRCVLLGLRAIHAAGFGHADMRWSNVILVTASHFCIIDLELALPLGSPQGHRQPEETPAAWGDGGAALVDGCFTAASDLFMVGRMLQHKLAAWPCNDSLDGAASLAQKLVSKEISLDEALQHVWLQHPAAGPGAQ